MPGNWHPYLVIGEVDFLLRRNAKTDVIRQLKSMTT